MGRRFAARPLKTPHIFRLQASVQIAASVLWAVDLPDDGPTGDFFRDGRPVAW
jgi:hypothetical protein